MSSALNIKLPELYTFIGNLNSITYPTERWATCESCILQRDRTSAFLNTKCCTYYPHLMNYAVGGLLIDINPLLKEGQDRVLIKIKSKAGVTPYGVISTVQYDQKRKKADDLADQAKQIGLTSHFTRTLAESLLCPYYQDGFCSVWAYREHCCSTFFCVSVGGEDGKAFWKAVDDYLIVTEQKLSKYVMLQLGWDAQKILTDRINSELLGVEDEKGNINEDRYAELWGDWTGKEIEFYVACYEIIKNLTEEEFKRIMGLEHDILYQRIQFAHGQFVNPAVPQKLYLNPEAVFLSAENGWVDIKLNDDYHRRVPSFAKSVLNCFDGKKETTEILAEFGPLGEFFKRDFLIPVYKNRILIDK